MSEMKMLDMNAYPRRGHFDYFRGMRNPYVGITVDVDVTALVREVKSEKLPFFLTFLYCTAKAANSVPELRQRIVDNGVVEFERCPSSYTVGLEDGTYCYCRLDTDMPFENFLPYAVARQQRAVSEASIDDGEDPLPLFFVSTVPWLRYSALVQPTPEPPDSNPRITWGKFEERDGKIRMPVTLLCNHAIVDGLQIAEFFTNLGAAMDEITG